MSQPHEPPISERPTSVRYGVLTLLCVLAFILYLDRICISQAVKSIEAELHIEHDKMSYVVAAFTLAYSLFEVPTGWWGDKFGSRGVVVRIVLWWSAFTALTGAAWSLSSLIAIRFLFGAGEAGAYPNAARIISKWFPLERRGAAQGFYNFSAQIGGAVAPVMAAFLIDRIGWRWSFVVFSLPGPLWVIGFWYFFRDDPQTHPALNDAERRLIAEGTQATHGEHPPIPWRAVLTHPAVWLLGFVLVCSAFNSYLYFTWYPTYLKEARGLKDEMMSGMLSSIVLVGGACGSLSGGYVIDWLIRVTGNSQSSRRALCCTSMTLAAVSLLIGKQCESPLIATLWTAGSLFMTVLTLSSWWGHVTDVSGRHLGALFGLMNSMGAVGAISSQLFVGHFATWMKDRGYEGRAQWDPIFYVYAGMLLLGACGWAFIDSRRSVEAEPFSGDHSESPRKVGHDSFRHLFVAVGR